MQCCKPAMSYVDILSGLRDEHAQRWRRCAQALIWVTLFQVWSVNSYVRSKVWDTVFFFCIWQINLINWSVKDCGRPCNKKIPSTNHVIDGENNCSVAFEYDLQSKQKKDFITLQIANIWDYLSEECKKKTFFRKSYVIQVPLLQIFISIYYPCVGHVGHPSLEIQWFIFWCFFFIFLFFLLFFF